MPGWEDRLYKALEKNDTNDIDICLNHEVDLNECSWTAKKADNMEIVKTLIDLGADPNYLFRDFVVEGKLEMVKYLIERDANTCIRSYGDTPLSLAISTENMEMVKLLLNNGAQFTIHSGLMKAVKTHNLEIVRLLLKHGASVNVRDENGNTPLIQCLTEDELDLSIISELLENGADVNMVTQKGTPLLKSIDRGKVEVTQKLIQSGADVNTPDDNLKYPIICAVKNRRMKLLELLVKNGANLNVVDTDGVNALIEAVNQKNFEMVKYLVEQGIDLNQKSTYANTALEKAIYGLDFRTVDFLLKSGADQNFASEAIEKTIKRDLDFAVYMAKVKENNTSSIDDVSQQVSRLEWT